MQYFLSGVACQPWSYCMQYSHLEGKLLAQSRVRLSLKQSQMPDECYPIVLVQVCFVIKVYLQKSATDNWLKPYISAFLAAREASGLVMRGPVELGAYSGCLGRGGSTPSILHHSFLWQEEAPIKFELCVSKWFISYMHSRPNTLNFHQGNAYCELKQAVCVKRWTFVQTWRAIDCRKAGLHPQHIVWGVHQGNFWHTATESIPDRLFQLHRATLCRSVSGESAHGHTNNSSTTIFWSPHLASGV